MTYEEELLSINENLVKQIGERKQRLLERKKYLYELREKKKKIVKNQSDALKKFLDKTTTIATSWGTFTVSGSVDGVIIP